MDLHQTANGRRILYLAHESEPKDFTGVDVTDLANPKVAVQTDLDHGHLRSNSLSILGDTMLVAYQSQQHGQPGTGMGVYDISNPEDPKRIAFYDAQGPGSRGCHCLWWVDGNYAHLATGTPDSRPTDPKDDQFYVIMDVSNPANPREAGRWWLPGTQEGDDAPPPDRHPYLDVGHSVHNTNVYPNRADRAYCGWKDSGVITLDISDVSRPSMVAQLKLRAALPGVYPHRAAAVQPRSAGGDPGGHRPGRRGLPQAGLADGQPAGDQPGDHQYAAHAGHRRLLQPPRPLRRAQHPREPARPPVPALRYPSVRYLLQRRHPRVRHHQPLPAPGGRLLHPPNPEGADANGINDVHVDENGIMYVVDRLQGGLYILEMNI